MLVQSTVTPKLAKHAICLEGGCCHCICSGGTHWTIASLVGVRYLLLCFRPVTPVDVLGTLMSTDVCVCVCVCVWVGGSV